ncbi:unnamed protein product, partial [Iphiclides podalirius]
MMSSDIINKNTDRIIYPEHADVVIIGGGFIGASVGYWLKTRAGEGLSVVILEEDFTYARIQNNVSLGILNQHFSLPENINLSQYSVEFLRNVKNNLNSDVDIQFCPIGHLILASDKYAERLEQNVAILKEYGVKNELLTTNDIQEKYPWINTVDIKLGCISTESEGIFNPWALLKGLVMECKKLGVTFVNAKVVGFEMEQQQDVLMEGISPGNFKRINQVIFKTNDNEEHTIKFAIGVLSAGDSSGKIAKLAQIGLGDDLLKLPLPVERREYNIYKIRDSDDVKINLHTPCLMDTSGLWLRRNSIDRNFLCGVTPLLNSNEKELLSDGYYADIIEPSLLNRYQNIKQNQISKLKTEIDDCNTYDGTGILGYHPYHTNMILAAGFGKLGCQHAPGIGRAIAEIVIDGHYTSIDLTRFGFDRLLIDEPLVEFNVY